MYRTAVCILIYLALLCTSMGAQQGEVTAEGSVVAVQKAKDEIRIVDPHSMGDLVEVWMLRVDQWSLPEKPGFILVEYTHHDSLIPYSELDRKQWNFKIRPAPRAESGTCLSWWGEQRSFQPTTRWLGRKLPEPKRLPCYLMEQRPVAIDPDRPQKSGASEGPGPSRAPAETIRLGNPAERKPTIHS